MDNLKFQFQTQIQGSSNDILIRDFESLKAADKRDPFYRHADHDLLLELVTAEVARRGLAQVSGN